MAREPKPLPPPTAEERLKARRAADALKLAIALPTSMGEPSTAHIDLARPRRGLWITTWANLPGFARYSEGGRKRGGRRYAHDLLPGWEYARHEVKAEMIPDLEALAERGIRPTEATSERAA